MICTTLIISGDKIDVRKELVTNLTDNEALIQAAVFSTTANPCNQYTYIKKYKEGDNWVFVFDFTKHCDIVEFGVGGLTKFISKNWTAIARLLALLGIVAIVWLWRDAVTKNAELTETIVETVSTCIQTVLADTTLTEAEKTTRIEQCLKMQELKPTDWKEIAVYGIAALAGAYILGSILKSGD